MKARKLNFKEELAVFDGSIQKVNNLSGLVSMLYQENSKLTKCCIKKQGEDIARFSIPYVLERASQPYKAYPGRKVISFHAYENNSLPSVEFFPLIQKRRSRRAYTAYSISLNELYHLFHFSYGITGEAAIKGAEGHWKYRAVPSGGALYPLELYVYLNCSALPKGIYHYRPDISALELVNENDFIVDLRKMLIAEPYVDLVKCSCVIFITSVMQRTLLKYGERGYRFIMYEVGFVSQQISLISEALGLSSCMIGSFVDDQVNDLLQADGVLETVQNVIVIGSAEKTESL